MVQMPVRVKPPPADTGEIISPGCAALAITTPPNGARMRMSSSSRRCKARPRSATTTFCARRAKRACSPSTFKRSRSRSAWPDHVAFGQRARAINGQLGLANVHARLLQCRARRFKLRFGQPQPAREECLSYQHREQRPSSTVMPSSMWTLKHFAGCLGTHRRLAPCNYISPVASSTLSPTGVSTMARTSAVSKRTSVAVPAVTNGQPNAHATKATPANTASATNHMAVDAA